MFIIYQSLKEGESCNQSRREAETQTTDSLFHPALMDTTIGGCDQLSAGPSPLTPGRSLALDLTHRTSGYFSREASFARSTPPRASRESTPLNSRRSLDTPLHNTPRQRLSTASAAAAFNNGNPVCGCPGCPGNPDNAGSEPEDYLDTLDRKVSEIINKDCSRRSSYHDLNKKDDIFGPLSYGRKRGLADLNHNPQASSSAGTYLSGGGATAVGGGESVIRFEEDGKASSSEGLDSSQEDLSHVWSDEDSDQYVLRRRR